MKRGERNLHQPPRQGEGAEENGFTLVELLVVIAVIAILASLLLPALLGAKRAGQSTFCKNNLRQMSLALQLYANDHLAFPYFASNSKTWWELLRPYYVNQWSNNAYLCPSYHSQFNRLDAPNANGDSYGSTQVSYGINYLGLGFTPQISPSMQQRALGVCSHANHPLVRDGDIRAPFDMIAFGDSFCSDGKKIITGFGIVNINTEAPILPDETNTARKRHRGRLNVSFCDGHTVSVPYGRLLLDQSDESLQRWNNDHLPHRELLHR